MRPGISRLVAITSVLLFAASSARAADTKLDSKSGAKIDFVKDVAPIFKQHCYECHGPNAHEAGLRLSRRDDAMAGGDSGDKVIVPGKPDESRMIKLVSGQDPKLHMPPADTGDELSKAELDVLKRWIADGATWPAEADVPNKLSPHWAWKPPVQAPLPPVKN